MNIEELLNIVQEPIKEEQMTIIDGQSLNQCIDALYALEDLALQDEDEDGAQMLKNARIWVEDYRKEYILQMGESKEV